jgi:hypothetical protein
MIFSVAEDSMRSVHTHSDVENIAPKDDRKIGRLDSAVAC